MSAGRATGATRPLDETFAWGCLVTNLVGVPGVGTLLAGHRAAGAGQLALALAGGVPLTYYVLAFLGAVLRTLSVPPEGGPPLGIGLLGLGLFAAGWLWSLVSSVQVLRLSRRVDRPSPGV